MNTKKKSKVVFGGTLALAATIALASCGGKKTTNYKVSFNVNDPDTTDTITLDEIESIKVKKDGVVDLSKYALTYEGYEFAGWYTDSALSTEFTSTTKVTDNLTLYAKWVKNSSDPVDPTPDPDPTPTEGADAETKITYEVDFNSAIENKEANEIGADGLTLKNVYLSKGVTLDGDGSTTIDGTSYKRIKNIKGDASVDGDTATLPTKQYIKVSIGGKGKVTLHYAPGGSSDRSLYVIDKDGKVLVNKPNGGSSAYTTLEIEFDAANEIYICGSNGHNFYKIDTEYTVVLGEETGIEVTNEGKTSYIAGMSLDQSSLEISGVYSSGATKVLNSSELTIDNSAVDLTKAGIYKVNITHGTFTTSYDVVVYDLADMELGFNKIEKLKNNTTAGNGQYFNQTVQQVYGIGDKLDFDALTVLAYTSNDSYFERFTVDSSFVTVSEVDMTTAGEKTVTITISMNGVVKTEEYKIYVTNTEIASVLDGTTVSEVNLYVDPNYSGVIGTQETYGTISKTCNTFKTIQQALDYLQLQDGISTARKNIYVAAGTYNEKIEITLAYTSIIGIAGADNTTIEWGSLFGIEDESGFGHVTDSTATVAVRDTAVNCIIDGITISNYYNDIQRYASTPYGTTAGERALALLGQADQMIVQNCKLLGWQDTLELFTGRQYFKDCYISGCVDYIFGTNNTTLFDGCTIHTVKGKTNNTDTSKVMAYVTAFKGQNKGTSDAVNYGGIFNNCNFTVEDGFVGKVAIARPWTATSAVAVLNSDFSNLFATKESTTIATGLIKDVNVNTLKIKFYNNTMDSAALTFEDDLTNVDTTLTSTQAANYVDTSVIFGETNGGVTWNTAWDPSYTGVIVDTNVYYNFGAMPSTTGTVYDWTATDSGAVNTTWNGLTINTNKCKYFADGYTEVQAGTIQIDVAAGTTLSVKTGYSTNNSVNINGFVSTTDTLTQYFATAQTVTINITAKAYILGIKVDTSSAAPTAATAQSISVSGAKDTFELNDTFATTGLVIKENYSDGTYKVIEESACTIDSSAVKMDTNGEYTVNVTYGTLNTSYTVTVGADLTITESLGTSFKGNNYNSIAGATVYSGTFDASSTDVVINNMTYSGFKSNNNTAGSWIVATKADATITFDVSGACTLYIGYYNSSSQDGTTVTFSGDSDPVTTTDTATGASGDVCAYTITGAGTVTITVANGKYLGYIGVVFATE